MPFFSIFICDRGSKVLCSEVQGSKVQGSEVQGLKVQGSEFKGSAFKVIEAQGAKVPGFSWHPGRSNGKINLENEFSFEKPQSNIEYSEFTAAPNLWAPDIKYDPQR
jgi:hypothetical protein